MVEHDDEMIEVREDYGFKAGLRQKPLDIIRRNEWLEKFNIPYAVSMKGLLLLVVGIGVTNTLIISYITNDFTRAKYIWFGMLLLDIAICLLIALASFNMPSYGSPLKSGYALIRQVSKREMIKLGILNPNHETGFSRVRKDGIILYANGDYGIMYKVDGRTSATAYPSEIAQQEDIMSRYHNGRLTTTTEFHITISQRQNAETQIKNQETKRNSTNRNSIRDLCNVEITNLEQHINGVKPVSEHFMIQRNPSEQQLQISIERLENFVKRDNMYNSILKMNQKDTEKILTNFFKLK
ncbi:hypothetical protein [Staphylococcus argenteus]|uniref:hypothetical protein n=1 Tax=Staphylococcus argenteus TaxID=985002 RepID=UPI000F842399|nr:hypothetical protein [Staphylococcus argenteus]